MPRVAKVVKTKKRVTKGRPRPRSSAPSPSPVKKAAAAIVPTTVSTTEPETVEKTASKTDSVKSSEPVQETPVVVDKSEIHEKQS